MSPYTRANAVKSIRVFFRDYLHKGNLIKSFKVPSLPFVPKELPSKQELQTFFQHLGRDKERALFLMLASSGRRRNEILYLKTKEVDFDRRMLRPQSNDGSQTKHTFYSFYNGEAEEYLVKYLDDKSNLSSQSRLFNIKEAALGRIFQRTSKDSGIHISPKTLRAWFASEMIRLGTSETYVDAMCGRVPKSVLGRNYLDFSPKRLKEIYDKANIKILS